MSKVLLGVDLGGTRIKAVALDKGGNTLHQMHTPTLDGNDLSWKGAVIASIEELKSKLKMDDFAVGISAPGIPNANNSAIAHMPGRLRGLENLDWSSSIGNRTWVLNDAVSAMIAEVTLGVAKGKQNVVLITLGTGVGGAILIDGKPYQGSFQKAGHIGHITLDHEGEPDVTGMPGSLEDAIGNATIHKRSGGRYADTHSLLADYKNGDPFANEVWLSSVKKLAIGMACITNILSPECIILAGGISEAGKDLFEPLEHYLGTYEWRAGGNKTAIFKSQFGEMAGAIGAACFARMQDG